jgi:hypothetical protein
VGLIHVRSSTTLPAVGVTGFVEEAPGAVVVGTTGVVVVLVGPVA